MKAAWFLIASDSTTATDGSPRYAETPDRPVSRERDTTPLTGRAEPVKNFSWRGCVLFENHL